MLHFDVNFCHRCNANRLDSRAWWTVFFSDARRTEKDRSRLCYKSELRSAKPAAGASLVVLSRYQISWSYLFLISGLLLDLLPLFFCTCFEKLLQLMTPKWKTTDLKVIVAAWTFCLLICFSPVFNPLYSSMYWTLSVAIFDTTAMIRHIHRGTPGGAQAPALWLDKCPFCRTTFSTCF